MLPSFLQRFMGSNNNSTSSGDDRRTMKTEPGSSIGDVNNNKSTEELMMDINSGIKQENTVGDTRSDDERIGQDEFTPLSRNDNDLYLEDYSSSRRGGTSRRTNNNTQSHRINNNNRAIEAATTVSPRRPVAAKLVRTPPKGSPTRKVSRFNNGRSVKSSDEPPIVHRVDGINGINNGGYQSHQHASHPSGLISLLVRYSSLIVLFFAIALANFPSARVSLLLPKSNTSRTVFCSITL